eukprot:TRINITY_DN1308_c0_g1_i1.p1 TRINITY_DN1308_c0_g1~~TRINITY_DN1308_c0_g1_i1.p1  ORF type:complete len:221 (-),score=76.62 TRINITY_DN1308_c0_g1_i1:5-667(-)
MSTAGRPTWRSAVGGHARNQSGNKTIVPSIQTSARDIKGYTVLKQRQSGQQTPDEIKKRDLKAELVERERRAQLKKNGELVEEEEITKVEIPAIEDKPKNIDADDSDDEESSDESSEDEDDEEDTEELLRELERIKKEREREAKQNEMLQKAAEENNKEKYALSSNPLMSQQQDFNVKKRWYDESVFKNQAKGEMKVAKRFVNDTIRNDFHRKFLHKYVQ